MSVFSSGLLHPSINKWVAITVTGASSIVGYSVRKVWNQPVQEAKHLPFPQIKFLSAEIEKEESIEQLTEVESQETKIPEPEVKQPTPPQPQTQKPKPTTIIKPEEVETYPIEHCLYICRPYYGFSLLKSMFDLLDMFQFLRFL